MNEDLRTLLTKVEPRKEVKGNYRVYSTIDDRFYPIATDKYSDFWVTYCNFVERRDRIYDDEDEDPIERTSNNVKNLPKDLYIGEKITDFCPLSHTMTFRFQFSEKESFDGWEPYDDTFVLSVCSVYQDVLEDLFTNKDGELEAEFIVFVLESCDPFIEHKNGTIIYSTQLRLHFPYARLNIDWINYVFRTGVLQKLRSNNVSKLFRRAALDEWENIIPLYTRENKILPFYGSADSRQNSPLELNFVYHRIGEVDPDIEPDNFEQVPLTPEIFPLGNHKHITEDFVDVNIFSKEDHFHWLPFILSIDYWPRTLSLIDANKDSYNNIPTPKKETKNSDYKSDSSFDICNKLLRLINKSRFKYYPSWLKIGKALHDATKEGPEGLQCWIKNSAKHCEDDPPAFFYDRGDIANTCSALYHTFHNSRVNWISLAEFAKKDNPKGYSEWQENWIKQGILTALSADHSDVAQAIYRIFFMDYIFSTYSVNGCRWFSFNGNYWDCNPDGTNLRKNISGYFVEILGQMRIDLLKDSSASRDERFKEKKEDEVKALTALIKKCKNVQYKSCLMRECQELFECSYFAKAVNSNGDITGVTNGVLEVVGDNIYFRNGERQDYITMVTNVPVNVDFDSEHPLVLEVIDWLEKVFPDKTLYKHFMKFASSLFIAGNIDKIFAIWTGGGNNSKSMLVKLFESVWGAYCIKFPMTLVTDNGGKSSSATPELARAKDTRIAFLDESDDEVSLKKDIIKRLTGGDSFFARMLHDNGGDVKSTFKLVMSCNNPPGITNGDNATHERLNYMPFLSTWSSNAPEDDNDQKAQNLYKKDPNFSKRIPTLAPAFLWLCMQYFPVYKREGMANPEIVKQHTEKYWKDNDIFSQFISENIENDEGNVNASVTLTAIYSKFKTWFSGAFPGNKVPGRIKIKSELVSRWGEPRSNAWFGIRLISDDDGGFMKDMKSDFMKSDPMKKSNSDKKDI